MIERLLAAPHEFEFVQAVRVLLAWLARQGVAPEAALREHLRFENSLRLGLSAGADRGPRYASPGPASLVWTMLASRRRRACA
ncbi:hypothetical protein [Massilia sp. Dwa41.01b]|uniref:hypothetical protein n=1 Tax=Massilia sp. Dwa41.01b TaxID=2709302 RepID=UPI001AEEB847|nr:hypothetical protein [Massilia sp. Dwa41.01b]